PIVADQYPYDAVLCGDADVELRKLRSVEGVDCVVDEVSPDLIEFTGKSNHCDRAFRLRKGHRNLGGFDFMRKNEQCVFDSLGQIQISPDGFSIHVSERLDCSCKTFDSFSSPLDSADHS